MKTCANCGNFRLFYTKGISQFEKENQGKCLANKSIVQSESSCKQWTNSTAIRKTRTFVCCDILDNVKYDISQVIQILNEEREENEVNPL